MSFTVLIQKFLSWITSNKTPNLQTRQECLVKDDDGSLYVISKVKDGFNVFRRLDDGTLHVIVFITNTEVIKYANEKAAHLRKE